MYVYWYNEVYNDQVDVSILINKAGLMVRGLLNIEIIYGNITLV